MSRPGLARSFLGASLLALVFAGCATLLDYGDYSVPTSTADGGVCAPGDTRPCYDGPSGTEDAGGCRTGVQICDDKGAWSACMGEVTPDDGGCGCSPGEQAPCYDGPPGMAGIGICKLGKKTCDDHGQWGACDGSGHPMLEECSATASDPVNMTDENCDGLAGCVGAYRWGHGYGTPTSGQIGNAIAVDAEDNVIVVGRVADTVDFGGMMSPPKNPASLNEIYVLKLDPTGKTSWVKRYGSTTMPVNQTAIAVAVDTAGDIFVTGSVQADTDLGNGATKPPDPTSMGNDNDVFVLKLDPAGNTIWAKRFGDVGNQTGNGVAVDAQGNVFVVGNFTGSLKGLDDTVVTAGGLDIFVASLDAMGLPRWAKRFGDAATQQGLAITLDKDENPVIGGSFAGILVWDQMYASAPTVTNRFVGGLTADTGMTTWSAASNLPMSTTSVVISVAADRASGVIAFVGWETNPVGTDAIIGTAFGNPPFLNVVAGNNEQKASSVTIDSAGHIVVAFTVFGQVDFGDGVLTSSPVGGMAAAVAKYNANGKHIMSRRFGDGKGQAFYGVATDSQRNLLLTGGTGSPFDFGDGKIGSDSANNDIIAIKLSP